ncbi:hypothetical protein [Gilvibacter sediminis]|uniref:hypothetical protein n=1 Tax=Gilvibacter sediminis TaxID=379071 RepID=UPI002350F489|nr:hypothetical protein [Gilvibacter sediminis]MDC7998263.1 hypothetical protein [Gilvibacter sediminis]
MNKPNNKSTDTKNHQPTGKKSLYVGGILVILIAIVPFIFYSYRNFPDDTQVWETSFFTLETTFSNWFNYAWYLVGKIVPLYLLLLWFFTCKHWWHWIILVPIAMYSFQLWSLIWESSGKPIDELELVYIIPLMAVIVPAVYLVRAKLFNSIRGNDLQSFEEELAQEKGLMTQLKDLFR